MVDISIDYRYYRYYSYYRYYRYYGLQTNKHCWAPATLLWSDTLNLRTPKRKITKSNSLPWQASTVSTWQNDRERSLRFFFWCGKQKHHKAISTIPSLPSFASHLGVLWIELYPVYPCLLLFAQSWCWENIPVLVESPMISTRCRHRVNDSGKANHLTLDNQCTSLCRDSGTDRCRWARLLCQVWLGVRTVPAVVLFLARLSVNRPNSRETAKLQSGCAHISSMSGSGSAGGIGRAFGHEGRPSLIGGPFSVHKLQIKGSTDE
jgi:hypothetical protein